MIMLLLVVLFVIVGDFIDAIRHHHLHAIITDLTQNADINRCTWRRHHRDAGVSD